MTTKAKKPFKKLSRAERNALKNYVGTCTNYLPESIRIDVGGGIVMKRIADESDTVKTIERVTTVQQMRNHAKLGGWVPGW